MSDATPAPAVIPATREDIAKALCESDGEPCLCASDGRGQHRWCCGDTLFPEADLVQSWLAQARAEALAVPEVWSLEERNGLARAFAEANRRHGHHETLFATVAWFLRHRAQAPT